MPSLFERRQNSWLYGAKGVNADFVMGRANHLELENEELKQKLADLQASTPRSDESPNWSQRLMPGIIAVVLAVIGLAILRWLFTVEVDLTSINLGVVVVLFLIGFLLWRFIRYSRSVSRQQASEPVATSNPRPKQESTPVDSDQNQPAWRRWMGNFAHNRSQFHRGGES